MPTVPSHPLRVAVAQAPAVPGDLTGNALLAAKLVRQAAADRAVLVVLPELFLPAYHPPVLGSDPAGTDLLVKSGQLEDFRLKPVSDAVVETGIHAIVGASVRVDGHRFIAALHFCPDGKVLDAYHKQNLIIPDETDLFEHGRPGDTPGAIQLGEWVIGLGICYDGCFPEHARAAAFAGAHAYAVPMAFVTGSERRRDLYYAARALDNTFYVLASNAVDGPLPWQFGGGSAIYDPEGQSMGRAPQSGAGMVVADLDPEFLGRTRSVHRMLADLELARVH
jgi:predicted amidohydrolase